MATHDYVIANASGAAVRADLNNALAAIVTNNSGSSEPGTKYAFQWWVDTNANQLKLRNAANDDWIVMRELDGTMLIGTTTTKTQSSAQLTVQGSGTAVAEFYSSAGLFNTYSSGSTATTRGFIGTANQLVSSPSAGAEADFCVRAQSNLIFATNTSTERVRIDSSGSVGIGVQNPGDYNANARSLVLSGGITLANGTQGSIFFADSDSGAGESVAQLNYDHGSNFMQFVVNSAERVRISSGGNLEVCKESFGANTGSTNFGWEVQQNGNNPFVSHATNGTSATTMYALINDNGVVGTIVTTGSSTVYNTSSDYRLKENVVGIDDAITRLKQLAPKRFNFIADPDTTFDGFLAHEAQAVVPESVTGEKDAVDENGDAVMQGIDQSKLVPLLTAALQEAIAKIEILETKVAALEAG